MKIKQIVSKNIKLAVFVFLSVFSISFIASDVAYADAATDTCKSFGYTGANLAGCEYGYRNPVANQTDDQLNQACSSAGHSNVNGNRAACRVGSNINGNTSLASGAEAACESVGYYGSFKNDCIKSYNENSDLTDEELEKKCKGTGNNCYVGGKLKKTNTNAGVGTAAPTTQDYCDRIYGTIDPKSPAAAKATQRQQQAACKAGQQGKDCRQFSGPEKLACEEGADNSGAQGSPGAPGNTNQQTGNSCGGAKTNLIPCSGSGEGAITGVLVFALQIMTVGVGILAVGGITYGAILYASAQDNAGQTKKAIEVITNTVIGLLLYMFMFAILNLLVPGGVLT
ncbi:MAG: hypothetical protein EOO27_41210, partial [Comamonadaceae bacterium]